MWRDYDAMPAMTLDAALEILREDIEGMDYHPARPMIWLSDSTWLQPQLQKATGGESLGMWQAVRFDASQATEIERIDL
jgi:hypothetical protein